MSTQRDAYLTAYNEGRHRDVIKIIQEDRKTHSYPPIRSRRAEIERDYDEEADACGMPTAQWLRDQTKTQSQR